MALDFIGRYWRGEGPLWRIYWIYGVAVSCIVAAVFLTAAVRGWIGQIGMLLMLPFAAAYTAWILVSIWRCAFNIEGRPLGVEREGWGMLARWLTVAWAINLLGLTALVYTNVVAS